MNGNKKLVEKGNLSIVSILLAGWILLKGIGNIQKEWKVIFIVTTVLAFYVCSVSEVAGQGGYPYEEEESENTLPDWAGFTLIFLLCCGIPILWLMLSLWVKKDAEARGEEGSGWFLIVLFTGVIGLIIWFIMRPKQRLDELQGYPLPQNATCPHCGGPVKFKREKNKWGCPRCKKYVTPSMQRSRPPQPRPRPPRPDICPRCGAKAEYSEEYNDYYCWGCEEYIGDM